MYGGKAEKTPGRSRTSVLRVGLVRVSASATTFCKPHKVSKGAQVRWDLMLTSGKNVSSGVG